ncbi:MAG: hypothetical protein M1839_009460 [Geoglossum umbratile]|nr:MAG: hypothetical protein M1839_009460 [Geoglossum umbratile]
MGQIRDPHQQRQASKANITPVLRPPLIQPPVNIPAGHNHLRRIQKPDVRDQHRAQNRRPYRPVGGQAQHEGLGGAEKEPEAGEVDEEEAMRGGDWRDCVRGEDGGEEECGSEECEVCARYGGEGLAVEEEDAEDERRGWLVGGGHRVARCKVVGREIRAGLR